mgnify:CR=1 FL=1
MTKAAELAKMGEVLTNSQLGGRRNIIINGAFQIAQRGTSHTGVGNGDNGYYLDRFKFAESGTSGAEFTISQSTDSPDGFGYSMKFDCTTADTSLGSGEQLRIISDYEGQDLQQLKKGTSSAEKMTLSFHVKSNLTGTAIVTIYDTPNSRHISKSYTISSANTWEKKIITFEGDTSGAIDNDNTTGFRIEWHLRAGSDATSGTLATSWASYVAANQAAGQTIDLASSTDNEFYITGIQLEVGSQATPFEHRSFGEELLLCQRYFQLISGGAVMPNSSTGIEGSVTRQEMRAATSISVTAAMKVEDPSVTTYTQSSASATISNSDKFAEKFTLQNFSGLNTQRPYFLKNPQDGGGQIELDAEL